MEKQKISSSVATVCTLTLAVAGLASCNSVESQSLAQIKSVQTVSPLSQPSSQIAQAGLAAPTTLADANAIQSAPLDPATAILQKTGRFPAPVDAPTGNQIAALATAEQQQTAFPAEPEYYIIPGKVAVPTPRPGTTFASVEAAPVGSPLQQMAAVQVAQPQTSTQLIARMAPPPQALETQIAQLQSPVMVASANNDPSAYIVPGRVAVPEPRPGAELGYAPNNAGSAADAIAQQLPLEQQGKVEVASLDGASQSQVQTQSETGKPRNLLNDLIFKYSMLYGVPEHFVHRVAKRESTYNPKAYRAGNYGLMQIRLNTAKGLGYKGDAKGLFDAETNLKYAVKYLRGAWLVADGNEDKADKLYIKGFYYEAKKKGLLEETNMK